MENNEKEIESKRGNEQEDLDSLINNVLNMSKNAKEIKQRLSSMAYMFSQSAFSEIKSFLHNIVLGDMIEGAIAQATNGLHLLNYIEGKLDNLSYYRHFNALCDIRNNFTFVIDELKELQEKYPFSHDGEYDFVSEQYQSEDNSKRL